MSEVKLKSIDGVIYDGFLESFSHDCISLTNVKIQDGNSSYTVTNEVKFFKNTIIWFYILEQ
ncbi:hypothetical protein SAMN02745134_02954 [Clostridium acidisoli DSM 12555]|jgi:hypothetical protein|uniref:Lsm14-like N-terminal domain-containing protein n=1 Tax=Clostridium acidisoli DSM 12555 TaxID=1121291 RepID=A0A1W1XTD9_9CLOT|nr:hypothetical protein [Clostridium acidisoli]SMC26811.1 hypothetical protein SAMN02745134_02954 [Clostridium acidisoli DSM 12555]